MVSKDLHKVPVPDEERNLSFVSRSIRFIVKVARDARTLLDLLVGAPYGLCMLVLITYLKQVRL
jgi:hypothetical protein